MKKGIVIYAHNNRSVDYALMALISGGLAKKKLKVPVSLITDPSTIDWMRESEIFEKATEIFEHIIIVNRPETDNTRRLHDGESSLIVPFLNSNRSSVWDLTPYDRTLMIDGDYLIFSDLLNEYWDVDCDVMIGESINDVYDNRRLEYGDIYVSDVGVKLYWATTVMFTKNAAAKTFFDTVNFIKDNYTYYADVFRFDPRQFRNDVAFSVAKHILDGYEETTVGSLPPVRTLLDKDILEDVKEETLILLVSPRLNTEYCAAALTGMDLHVMNKQSIYRNKDKLLGLI